MTLDRIRKEIINFDWSNYGLDELEHDADPEYAEDLARKIFEAITPSTSVLRPWVMELPLRHQGTLLAAVRGCDNVPKRPYDSTSRALVAYLRYTFLVPADPNEVTITGAFMRTAPPERWRPSDLGHLPEHFYSHLMHAFEVVGYCCPHPETAQECEFIYLQLVHGLHLQPETREQMHLRLTEDRITSGTVVS